MKEIKWKCSRWTTDHWKHNNRVDYDKAVEVAKSYVGIEATFRYNDWYGDSSLVKIRITNVAIDELGYIIITLKSSSDIIERYFPTVAQVLNNHFGVERNGDEDYYRSFTFAFPTSYQQVK